MHEHSLSLAVLTSVKVNERQSSRQRLLARLRYLFLRVCSCRHPTMSRPFTRDGNTYRVCVRCGMHRGFDLKSWKAQGPFYNEKGVEQSVATGKTANPLVASFESSNIHHS